MEWREGLMASNKNRKTELKKRRSHRAEMKRQEELAQARSEGRLIGDQIMPKGAIKADVSKQKTCSAGPWTPKLWYVDTRFSCTDCGKREVWTAKQQKWWYEECQGIVESKAVRCRACRKKRKEGGKLQSRKSGS